MTTKRKAKSSDEKYTNAFLKAWLSCPRDDEGERDVSNRFVDKALTLMEKGQLQKTVNDLIQTGRLKDFNDGIDLNFQAQCLSTLITAEEGLSRSSTDPFAHHDEFHLVALPWTGNSQAFDQYEASEFREELLKALEMHFRDILGPQAEETLSFALRLPSTLTHPAVFAALPSDQKNLVLQHMFGYSDDEGFRTLFELHQDMMGNSETPDHPDQMVLGERLILLGVSFAQKDFSPDFNLGSTLMNASSHPEAWAGATLTPPQTSLMPPMPLNGALIHTLSTHLKNHFFVELQSDDAPEDLELDGMNIAYNPHLHAMVISALANQNVFSDVEVPMEWFFACGLSSVSILQSLLDEEDQGLPLDTSALEVTNEGRDEIDQELDRLLPSFWQPYGSHRIH